jgi:hypothetical protein
MTCQEAGLREDAAFTELQRALAHRQRVDAKVAIYNDHWEGYEAAFADLEAAAQAYLQAAEALRRARSQHREAVSS